MNFQSNVFNYFNLNKFKIHREILCCLNNGSLLSGLLFLILFQEKECTASKGSENGQENSPEDKVLLHAPLPDNIDSILGNDLNIKTAVNRFRNLFIKWECRSFFITKPHGLDSFEDDIGISSQVTWFVLRIFETFIGIFNVCIDSRCHPC